MTLVLDRVTKSFGGIRALTRLGFTVPERSIFGLIGPNGAGKTTVFNLVTGVYTPDSGSILFSGKPIVGKKPARIAATGIARTFQNIRLFGQLSVLENVLVACETTRRSGLFGALLRTRRFREDERALRDALLKSPSASLLDFTRSSTHSRCTVIRGCSASIFSKIARFTFGSLCVPRSESFTCAESAP